MRVPSSELPDLKQIKRWANENLPVHYRLLDVRCVYNTDILHLLPEDWEIAIEYANNIDDSMIGSADDIGAHHSWADPLIAKIRGEWPASTVRIGIKERLAQKE